MSREIVVLVTAPTGDLAARIAEALVMERLAPCVNIIPKIHSVYWWEERVNHDEEALLIIKTTAGMYGQLEERVKQLHTYSTPEIIGIRIEMGSEQYLNWLREASGIRPGKD